MREFIVLHCSYTDQPFLLKTTIIEEATMTPDGVTMINPETSREMGEMVVKETPQEIHDLIYPPETSWMDEPLERFFPTNPVDIGPVTCEDKNSTD